MTRSFAFSVICLTFSVVLAGSAAADDLFSSIPIDSVFKPTNGIEKEQLKPTETTDKAVRVLNLTQLTQLLKDAKLDPEEGDSVASIKVLQGTRTFNVAIGLDEGRQQILLLMRLADLDGKTTLSAERMMTLLTINRDLRPVMFCYSEKNKRLELLRGLENDQISPRMLREEIKRLAGIAESTAGLWEVAPATQAPAGAQAAPLANNNRPAGQPVAQAPQAPAQSAPAQAAPQAPAQTAPVATAGLLGKWSAARSAKEAFAMQLNSDNSFVLVYVKDGKQSKSVGTFTTTGGQLTLTTSDGGKFAGNVSNVTARTFDFTPPTNAAGKLTFQKAG